MAISKDLVVDSEWRFPLLSDARTDVVAWPSDARLEMPTIAEAVNGEEPTVLCPMCQMPRVERDTFDLRPLAEWKDGAGLDWLPDFCCTFCFHHHLLAKGATTWGALARALGAPAELLAAYDGADVEAVKQGFATPKEG